MRELMIAEIWAEHCPYFHGDKKRDAYKIEAVEALEALDDESLLIKYRETIEQRCY